MLYNTRTKGHSTKLEGGKFKTDQRKYFYMCVQTEKLPATGDSDASNAVSFGKGWRLDGQHEHWDLLKLREGALY